MPNWLSISLGVLCAFWAFGQLRMTLVYLGASQSPTVGPFAGPQITLMHTAIRSALSFGVFSLIFFFVSWPKNLLSIIAVLALRAVIDLILLWKSVGMFGIYAPAGSFEHARPSMLRSKTGNILFFVFVLAAMFYFSNVH